MKNRLLPGRNLLILLIILLPFLLGSSNRKDNDTRFSLINYSVFRPGSDVRINLYSSSSSNNTYRLRLFKIKNVENFFSGINKETSRYNFDVWGNGAKFMLRYADLVKNWETNNLSPGYQYNNGKNLDLGKIDKPGYYILQALSGNQVAYCGIVVSDMAIVYKNSGKHLLVFTAKSDSGNIVRDVSYALYDNTKLLSSRNSDKDGLAIFNISDTLKNSDNPFQLIAKAAGETILSDPYFYFGSGNDYYTAYIYTNQPVYRPGQKVYFKAIMRKNSEDGFRNVPGEKFKVSIRSSKNKEIYSGSLRTNEFGTLAGSFDLDKEADLGNYSVAVSKDNMLYYGSFEVEEFKKPEYFVKIETNNKQFAAGDTVKASISADYYFGSPVTDAKVEVNIYRRHYWHPWWYWSQYAWFYKNFASNRIVGYGDKDLVSQKSGRLGPDGKFNYEFTAPLNQDVDYVYTISAEVTDNSRSTVSGDDEIYITRGSFSIDTSPEKYFVPLGQPVTLRINTADFSSKPVPARFRLVVNYPVLKNGDAGGYNPPSDTISGATDSLGKALVSFLPRMLLEGYYKYTVYSKDEKGRRITAGNSFYMGSGRYYNYNRYGSGPEIVTDKDSYVKGDSLTAFIFFPQTNMDALVSYESKDFIGYKVYRIDKNNLTVKLKLTGEYAPSFNIGVTYLKNSRLEQANKTVGVLDKDKFLTVIATPSKKVYKPGETVKYTLSVTDNNGNPVRDADLSVGTVDESIYAVKEDETPDIKTFYYAPRYTYIPTYCSLQNGSYNGISRHATLLDTKTKYDNLSPMGTGNLFGKLITKQGQVKFGNIYILISGGNYFYSIKADTSGKYMFPLIKQGTYELFTFLDDNELIYRGNVDVQDETLKNIDLGDYSNIRPVPFPIRRPMVFNELNRFGVLQSKASDQMALAGNVVRETQSFVKPQVRSKFTDAAFWDPDVITDINGKAEVSFSLPDNLTTWRTTIKGITGNTLVGQDTSKIISRKNLLIRLETPRFFRDGDELIVSTIVHNYLKTGKEVKIALDPGKLNIIDSRINQASYDTNWSSDNHKIYDVNINNDSEVRIDWRVKVSDPIGIAEIEASALTDEESDAVKVKVPIEPNGIKVDVPISAEYSEGIGEKDLTFSIPDQVDLRTAKLSFSVSPSLAGTMLKALDDLAGYPYGCVEQTMSRFLPTIIVANTFRSLDAPVEAKTLEELPKMVDAGLKRLYYFQHADGGWGWWTNDNTNPYMTAYVMYGFTLAEKAGYKIDSAVYNNGLTNLKNQLETDENGNFTTKAFMIYALTTAEKGNMDKKFYSAKIDSLLNNNLNPYALSLLALSAYNMGDMIRLSAVLNRLVGTAAQEGNYVYWGGKAWHYSWHNDKVQSTAFAVKALLLSGSYDRLVYKAVRWLLLQKQGFSWHSTQETAAVIFSLTDYLKLTKELNPNFNISVYLNNEKILDKNFTKSDVFDEQPSIEISGETDKNLHHGSNTIVLVKKGDGIAYISGINEYYMNDSLIENNQSFKITRQYYLLKAENTGDKIIFTKNNIEGKIKSGDIILVKTHVQTGDNGLRYFILEDMLPSGFEPVKDESKFEIEGESRPGNYYLGVRPVWFYADKEYRDDRVSFFVTDVNKDMNFSYIIRAEIPGGFNVSPAKGYLMYYPEISGFSRAYKFKVSE